MKSDATLDTVGLLCPIPIYLTRRKIDTLSVGQVLEVISDDEAILSDMPAWCRETGQTILHADIAQNPYRFFIQKEK